MARLNLYKIDSQKHEEFEATLAERYTPVGTQKIVTRTIKNEEVEFIFSFFIDIPDGKKPVEWSWLLESFGSANAASRSNPKGILLIKQHEEIYACTFGFSYFIVDKYCDTDFAFNFARRMKFKEVKTTTLLSPSSKRNKAVNTYIDYSNLEFDSGESFTKLKVEADLPDEFTTFEPTLEIGHSIKLKILRKTIDSIIDVLIYIKEKLHPDGEDIYQIPVFNKVTDKEMTATLNSRLAAVLEADPLLINLSELDIIGATEIFRNNDSTFKLKYGRQSATLSHLNSEQITCFIQDNNLSLYEGLKKVNVVSYYNDAPVRTDKLFALIDYIDDEKRCVLSKGNWYYFNDDYLGYLADSLDEIEVIYNPQYDYSTELHNQFIEEKYNSEKGNPDLVGLNLVEAIEKLRKKYYRERAYNLYINDYFGYECHDREDVRVGTATIELMDLYKDETLLAVKIGSTSSTLCYVVDQSTNALKLYKQQVLKKLPTVKKFGVWLVLDRRNHLPMINGKPDINQLEMLALKNKLDAWKKEVRVLGFTPTIMINYFNAKQ